MSYENIIPFPQNKVQAYLLKKEFDQFRNDFRQHNKAFSAERISNFPDNGEHCDFDNDRRIASDNRVSVTCLYPQGNGEPPRA